MAVYNAAMSADAQMLYTAVALRQIEQRTFAEGISETVLMRRAGSAAWRALQKRWPKARHIAVLTGSGNNAGDGYVLAAAARLARKRVSLLNVGETTRLPQAAAAARRVYLKAGGKEQAFEGTLPADADVIVDALFGIGLSRPLENHWRVAVEQINASGKPVLSLDIPSGLHADNGAVLGAAVCAGLTVTFIVRKAGLYTGAGPEYTGEIVLADLDLPPAMRADVAPAAQLMAETEMRLPRRTRSAHKGDFGHVLVIGGEQGMGGAVRLAAEAALRSGAGLVTVATRAAHVADLLAGLPEAMIVAAESAADLDAALKRATVIAIGTGLGQNDWGRTLFARVLNTTLPLVVDADALNLLAAHPVQRGNWILTPHPGEAGRLLNQTTAGVQQDRYQAAARIAERYRAVAVLKGAGSLVAAPDELTAVCTAGNPGMAAPGMGDVLTGVIVALVAQGLSLPQATRAGVQFHALAGDRAAQAGERGLLARDLISELRSVVNS